MQNKKLLLIIAGVLLLLCCCTVGGVGAVLLFFTPGSSGTRSITPDNSTTANTPTTPAEVTFIADPFDDNKLNEWLEDSVTNEYGTVTRSITGGKYFWDIASKKALSKSVLPTGLGALADGELSIDGRVVSADAEAVYGLLFRYSDTSNYYTVRISEKVKAYSLVVMKQGVSTSLVAWTENSAIKTTGNNLKVSFVGPKIRIYVNNILIKEVTDSTFDIGWYCLNAEFYGVNQNAKFEFDNFAVRKF